MLGSFSQDESYESRLSFWCTQIDVFPSDPLGCESGFLGYFSQLTRGICIYLKQIEFRMVTKLTSIDFMRTLKPLPFMLGGDDLLV